MYAIISYESESPLSFLRWTTTLYFKPIMYTTVIREYRQFWPEKNTQEDKKI